MIQKISLQQPRNPQEAQILAKAHQVRQRAEAIENTLCEIHKDSVQLSGQDTKPAPLWHKGYFDKEGLAVSWAEFQGGKVEKFSFTRKNGEGIDFDYRRSAATGLRAGAAAALGAVSGGLGRAAAWCLVKAIYSDSDIGTSSMDLASRGFVAGRKAVTAAQDWVTGPGPQDPRYIHRQNDGSWEAFRFTAAGDLEYSALPPLARPQK
jgi:hypothetical protein